MTHEEEVCCSTKLQEDIKALKKENADLEKRLNKLKSYVHPRHHYLYFKEKKQE